MKKITILVPLLVLSLTSCGTTKVNNIGDEITKDELLNIVSGYDTKLVPDTYKLTNLLEVKVDVVVSGSGVTDSSYAISTISSEYGFDISTEGDYYLYTKSSTKVESDDEGIENTDDLSYAYVKANNEGNYDYYSKDTDETEASLVETNDFDLASCANLVWETRLTADLVDGLAAGDAKFYENGDGIITVKTKSELGINLEGMPDTVDVVMQFDENGFNFYQGLEDEVLEFSSVDEYDVFRMTTSYSVKILTQAYIGEGLERPY